MTTRQWILIDTEAAESKSVLTEVAIIVVQYNGQWSIIDSFHSLVMVNPASMDRQAASYVYKHITGLSYSTLNRLGNPYSQVIAAVHNFLQRYWWIPRFSRDPSVLDEPLLQLQPGLIQEVLTELRAPFSSIFHNRHQRPAELHTLVATNYCCSASNHHPLVSGGYAHCALSDVYEMLLWLMHYGKLQA